MKVDHEHLVDRISNNWIDLKEEINEFCSTEGYSLPKIIAVSKTQPFEVNLAAWDAGIKVFGENYAQEFEKKATAIPQAEWHFIGTLQRRNVGKVVKNAKFIHSVDSEKLIKRLGYFKYQGKALIQINISKELSKSGVSYDLHEIELLLHEALKYNLSIVGFMTIGGFTWSKERIREEYSNFQTFISKFNLQEVSLGMSDDWQEAIRSGSTMVRIGTRIFGERQK
jgi:pyridoxal phosphate enzyme (YggS family)